MNSLCRKMTSRDRPSFDLQSLENRRMLSATGAKGSAVDIQFSLGGSAVFQSLDSTGTILTTVAVQCFLRVAKVGGRAAVTTSDFQVNLDVLNIKTYLPLIDAYSDPNNDPLANCTVTVAPNLSSAHLQGHVVDFDPDNADNVPITYDIWLHATGKIVTTPSHTGGIVQIIQTRAASATGTVLSPGNEWWPLHGNQTPDHSISAEIDSIKQIVAPATPATPVVPESSVSASLFSNTPIAASLAKQLLDGL